MEALIFAAGLGTRLGALGERTPKALLDVGGRTMLELAVHHLSTAGVRRVVVNVHHHGERIAEFVRNRDLGVEVELSWERDRPLETGGGLLHARDRFQGDGPIFLYNVDVLTDLDLTALREAHERGGGPATLAVQRRTSSRQLLLDEGGLFGRVDKGRGLRVEARAPRGRIRSRAFAGIHIVSRDFLQQITERGVFSILVPYLRLAGGGAFIQGVSVGGSYWLDVGTPERLREARAAFSS